MGYRGSLPQILDTLSLHEHDILSVMLTSPPCDGTADTARIAQLTTLARDLNIKRTTDGGRPLSN